MLIHLVVYHKIYFSLTNYSYPTTGWSIILSWWRIHCVSWHHKDSLIYVKQINMPCPEAKMKHKKYLLQLGTKSDQANLISSWKKVKEENLKYLKSTKITSKDIPNQNHHQDSSEYVSGGQSRTKFCSLWWEQYKILFHRAFRNSSNAILTPLLTYNSINIQYTFLMLAFFKKKLLCD